MSTMDLEGLPYANQKIPNSLVERIRCQNGWEKLDLSLCNITKVPLQAISDHYEGQPQQLDLSYNSISFISPRFTLDMVFLTKLDLSKNQIRKLPDNFGCMRELVYLDLHRNLLETLPVSMGKMHRLSFLRISQNPFRAPLSDLVGQCEPGISAVALAGLVVQFLEEFANLHSQETQTTAAECTRRRPSKVHYRRGRSVQRGYDGDSSVSSFASGGDGQGDHNNNVVYDSSSYSPATTREVISAGLYLTFRLTSVLGLFLIMTSVLFALVVETPYLEYYAQRSGYFQGIWYVYKPLHVMATKLLAWIPDMDYPQLLSGPGKTLKQSWTIIETMEESYADKLKKIAVWLGIMSD